MTWTNHLLFKRTHNFHRRNGKGVARSPSRGLEPNWQARGLSSLYLARPRAAALGLTRVTNEAVCVSVSMESVDTQSRSSSWELAVGAAKLSETRRNFRRGPGRRIGAVKPNCFDVEWFKRLGGRVLVGRHCSDRCETSATRALIFVILLFYNTLGLKSERCYL